MKKWLYIIIIALGIGLDQFTKWMVDQSIVLGKEIQLIPNLLYLTNTRNTGAGWSLFSSANIVFFYVTTIIAVVAMVYFFKKTTKNEILTRFGIVLVFAGAMGNFIDRLIFQYVRDFIGTIIFGYYFPVFNIADMLIVFGIGFVILELVMTEFKKGGQL